MTDEDDILTSLLYGGFLCFRAAGGRRSVVLVVFIGGVTYAEISALRFLSSQVCSNVVITVSGHNSSFEFQILQKNFKSLKDHYLHHLSILKDDPILKILSLLDCFPCA